MAVEQLPTIGDSLELVLSAIGEAEIRASGQLLDRPRHGDATGGCHALDACCEMNGESLDPDELDELIESLRPLAERLLAHQQW